MKRFRGSLAILAFLIFIQLSFAQGLPVIQKISKNQQYDSSLLKYLPDYHLNILSVKASRKPATEVSRPLSPSPSKRKSTLSPAVLSGLTCTDTSFRLVTKEPGHGLGIGADILQTSDGNILVAGFHQLASTPYYTFPSILKYDINGNVLWSEAFDGVNIYPQNSAFAYKAFQLNDGNLLVAGTIPIPEAMNGRDEIILWKLTPNGNLIWVQTDSCSNWKQYSGNLNFTGIAEDPAGNIYLSANDYSFDAITTHSLVLKMDPAGTVIWDKAFSYRSTVCFGLLYLRGEISVYGTNPFVYVPNSNGNATNYLWNLRLNPATGDTIQTRAWYADFGPLSGWNSIWSGTTVRQLANGNVSIAGVPLSDLRPAVSHYVHGVAVEFSPTFDFISGKMVVSDAQGQSNCSRITQQSSGRTTYTFTPVSSGVTIVGSIENGQIVKNRAIGQSNYPNGSSGSFINTSRNGDILIQSVNDQVDGSFGLEFFRLHDSDTSNLCTGVDNSTVWVEPYLMLPYPRYPRYFCDSISSNTFRKTNRTIPAPTPTITQE